MGKANGALEEMVVDLKDTFKGLKVLVTGDTGFKGSWLIEWLLLEGAKIYGIGLKESTKPSLYKILCLEDRIDHSNIDIRNKESLKSHIVKIEPDIIFHLAAQPLVRYSYVNPTETFETNVMGTVNVLNAVRSIPNKCVGIFVTTDKCYENKEWVHSYREDDPMGGHDPYSSSKGCCELIINSFRQSYFFDPQKSGKAIASVRAGNVIGGGDWANDRIVPDCIKFLKLTKPIEVRNKYSTRPWQHVLEPLSGYLLIAAEMWRCLDGQKCIQSKCGLHNLASAFNFGPGLQSNKTVEELVTEIISHWDGSWIDKSNPNEVHEASLLNLAIDKAKHLLGWSPQWNFHQTVSETISWYKKFYSDEQCIRELTKNQILKYIND